MADYLEGIIGHGYIMEKVNNEFWDRLQGGQGGTVMGEDVGVREGIGGEMWGYNREMPHIIWYLWGWSGVDGVFMGWL